MNSVSRTEEFTGKIQQWFRENISTIAIVLMSVVYVFYGIIDIEESKKTIFEIIADCGVSFAYGFAMKCLLNNQGVANGEKSQTFINVKNFYTSLLDTISPIQHYLCNFCDYQNAITLKKAQTAILSSELLKYDDFINNRIDIKALDKKQRKAYYKARNIKINFLSEGILLSDQKNFIDTGQDIKANKTDYLKKSNTTALIIMIATAFIFGYFGFNRNEGFNWGGAIWCMVQVAYYLGFGIIQYFSGYTFITDTYKTTLVRKANYIEKFKNMYEENPDRFKDEEELEFERRKKQEQEELEKQLEININEVFENVINKEKDIVKEELEQEEKIDVNQ